MKNKKFIIAGIVLFFVVIVTIFVIVNNRAEDNEALRFEEEYESVNGEDKYGNTIRSLDIPKDNPFVYKKASEIIEMIEAKESFVVYFGFADCPWCRSVVPTLIEVAADLNLDTIYYVDVKDIRNTLGVGDDGSIVTVDEGSKYYHELVELLSNVLDDYVLYDSDDNEIESGEKRIYAPNIVSVVDGEAVKLETGISEKQTDAYIELSEEIKKDMYDKIKCSIKCVVDNEKMCFVDNKC